MGGLRGVLICCALGVGASRALGQVAPAPDALDDCLNFSSPDEVPRGLSTTDWCSIRKAYETNRHAAVAVPGGFQARNPGQHWLTRFDGHRFSIQPEAGGWAWGLQLERYGFAGRERTVTEPTRVGAAGQRVTYDWDATLQEWYINDVAGLEHGYTVRQRPPEGGDGSLTLTIGIRGNLNAMVDDDGRSVRFLNDAGEAVLTYTGLAVVDAHGLALAARFERLVGGLLLSIDERDACYPIAVDPIARSAYLKASNTDAGDRFGYSVAVSGDTVVVGAIQEDSNATGVDGIQRNNSASQSGAVYVFARSGATWSQQAYLKASNTDAGDEFGFSVAVSGDTVVVSANREASNATRVNGDQTSNTAQWAGAAYVFVRRGTVWSQQAYLKASNAEAGDFFGESVAVSGDTVVVGASGEDSRATGVNGDQGDNHASDAGAAYIFVRSGTVWSQQAYLKASNSDAGDFFGYSVALSRDTIVVGAYNEDSSDTGIDGDQGSNSANSSGAAYVFVRHNAAWTQQAYLKSSNTDAGDAFGYSLAASTGTIVVGAPWESSNAIGVNGDQANNAAYAAGAVYVFARTGSMWKQQAYLKASNAEAGDQFGWSVAASDNLVAIGAIQEASSATGVNGDQSDNSANAAGAGYAFVRHGSRWHQLAYLKASNTEKNDLFAFSVAASHNTIVVGALFEASSAAGVNGNGNDNSASAAGAAYTVALPVWHDSGLGLSGRCGVPILTGMGLLVPGSPGGLTLCNADPLSPAVLFVSHASSPVSFKGGTLAAFPFSLAFPLFTDGLGCSEMGWPAWPDGIPSNTSLCLQYAIVDATAPCGVSLSNVISATTP